MRLFWTIVAGSICVSMGVCTAVADPAPAAPSASPSVNEPKHVTAPKSIGPPHTAQQNYPYEARRLQEQGTVHITYTLEADGTPDKFSVVESSGFEDLDNTAIESAKTWRYLPATEDGRPIAVRLDADIRFSLGDSIGLPYEIMFAPYSITHGSFSSDAMDMAKKEGKVVLSFLLHEDGTMDAPIVVQSSGDKALDAKEIERVKLGHFGPQRREGKFVDSRVSVMLK
ncbi:MAG TPA: TonB family protein [Rhizomicrobium sp.]|jgi:TonB family protein|nr:TonB family protein [Rhizomicrobium sp.]